MRKHGWQLPYHPLQVVAISVFLALGFAFYVFFVPFVGEKLFQYVVMGLYTPLVTCVFCLYVWCAAADPGDPGIFRSKKYLKAEDLRVENLSKEFKQEGSTKELNSETSAARNDCSRLGSERLHFCSVPCLAVLFSWCGLSFMRNWCQPHERSSEQKISEEGMFYCSLCKVEVLKYSKHCRVCDKCVDSFDHHCRWINNCIGRKNYKRFFILMVSALLLLILQWSIGMLVLILCFVEQKKFSAEIISKLGSSFSLVPFVVVVAFCTLLAMVATLPLIQLFFFHILLIKMTQKEDGVALETSGIMRVHELMKPTSSSDALASPSSPCPKKRGYYRCNSCKGCPARKQVEHSHLDPAMPVVTYSFLNGISTYDYIIALREQEQEQEQEQEENAVGEQQSPQMSQVSSFTGLSNASSFNAFHRAAWCTPPRLFLEDQFDVVTPDIGTSVSHTSNKMMAEEQVKRRNAGTVKINPWTLARLDAKEVSKAAAQARNKSKILQPIVTQEILQRQYTDSSIGSGSRRMALRPDNRRRVNGRGKVPVDLHLEPLAKISDSSTGSNVSDLAPETATSFALQLEAMSAFRPMSSARIVASSPESSLDSPDLHPFRISSSGAEEEQGLNSLSIPGTVPPKGIELSRSTSDGYEASGGEDSDRIPSRIVHRSSNWADIFFGSEHV